MTDIIIIGISADSVEGLARKINDESATFEKIGYQLTKTVNLSTNYKPMCIYNVLATYKKQIKKNVL